jgi:SAM-dependent methyltransferase
MPDKRLSPVYYNKMMFASGQLRGSKRLLDVGCGEGGYFHMYRRLGIRYAGIDPDASVLKKGESVKVADAESIPFASGSFDTVVCMDVFEHAGDPERAISEIHRVLKRGGKLVASVPSARYPWTYDPLNAAIRLISGGRWHLRLGMWSWGHKRLYRREDFLGLLETGGFRAEKVEETTHGFVTSFISYIPYLSVHLISPALSRIGMKKTSKISVSGRPLESGPVFRIFNFLNRLDSKHFSMTHGVNICVAAVKR